MTDLGDFPRPHLAVDLVILTVGPSGLGIVVQRRSDGVAVLPGRFVRPRHTVLQTAGEVLSEKLGYRPRHDVVLEQLGVYDAPERDERGWVVSLSQLMALRAEDAADLDPERAEVLPVRGDATKGRRVTRESLAYDHDEMVTTAVRRARRRYETSPDPLRLAGSTYTLSELRHVHEAVLGEPLKRDTFNRRMQPYVVPAHHRNGEPQISDTGGRPAQMFRPVSRRDRDPEAGPFPLPRASR
jgi:8-oxo-dGTP diphosphatase